MMQPQPALFLDRDGVLNENRPNYVLSLDQLDIYPQALEALRLVAALPIKIIVITNQSAVGRGLLTLHDADMINQHMVDTVKAAGGRIDAVYICPHHPADRCECRKPAAGMLQQAAREHLIDLESSALVGDAASDIAAGQNAGIAQLALLATGRGEAQRLLLTPEQQKVVRCFTNFEHCVKHLHCLSSSPLRLSFYRK